MQPAKSRYHLVTLFAIVSAAAPAAAAADPSVEALALYRAGKCDQAEPLLRNLLAAQPKNTAARKLLAGCLVQLHRGDEARQEYQQVLKVVPGDPEAVRALQPPPPETRRAQAPAPAPQPSERARAGAPLENAERLIAAGKLGEAERILADLVKRSPDLAIPQQRLAEVYTAQKEYGKAANEYLSLAEKHSGTPMFLLRAAQNSAWAQDYGPAADSYRRYLLQKPADSSAQLELAGVLLWWNHLHESAEAYRAYLTRNPDDVEARLNLADALLWSKKFDEASGEFRHVLERRENDADAQYGLGQCYEQAARLDLALKAYQKAAELNPQDQKMAAARDRVADALPQHTGFARLEKKEYGSAAGSFVEYLKQHPDSTDTMLEVARVYSWGKQYAEAAQYYQQYLDHVPNNDSARRELAKVELTIPDYAHAQQEYARLADSGHATVEDYEGLVNALAWDNKLAEAQPYAEKLAALSPGNPLALETRKQYRDQERAKTFEAAQNLTTAGRNEEAVAVYNAYATKFGTDKEIDLAICRVYNWSKQYPTADLAYQEYLRRYGEDTQARLELADVEKWEGQYAEAERSYREVLATDKDNANAKLGLAQIYDQRGDDRFEVVKAYRQALVDDSADPTARERIEELGPAVSPSLAYRQTSFTDSDSFARSVNRFEGAFPLRGGLKLVPLFGYDYFSQDLQVGGTACGSKPDANTALRTLDSQICGKNGTVHATGAGGRIEYAPTTHLSLLAEAYQARMDLGRNSGEYRGDLVYSGTGHALIFSVIERDAIYDVNTVASLFDNVRGRHAFLTFQQSLTDRWRLWILGGLSDYSRSNSDASPDITQRRFGARLDYAVSEEFTAGYFARGTSFSQASPLFFSPSYYGTYGFAYSWRKPISKNVRLNLDGELGYGQIDRFANPNVSTLEVMIYPSFAWRIRPDINLLFGYRYGRGRSSAFGSPVYTTNSIDFRLESAFTAPVSHQDPPRLNLQ